MNFHREMLVNFLMSNGFEKEKRNQYSNKKCIVAIEEDGKYSVNDRQGATLYSPTPNIFWLIGLLTYLGFIDKNYKIPNALKTQ